MYLKKEESEIAAEVLLDYLLHETFDSIYYGTEQQRKTLEKVRNVFRKIKKELGIQLTEEEALRAGLIEEIPKETLEKYAAKPSVLPSETKFEKLPLIARYFLKEK